MRLHRPASSCELVAREQRPSSPRRASGAAARRAARRCPRGRGRWWLVEQHVARVADQRLRDAEALAHALRVRPHRVAAALARGRRARATGRPRAPRSRRASPCSRASSQQVLAARSPTGRSRSTSIIPPRRARASRGCASSVEAVDQHAPRGRPVEAERDPHRGRLAGAVVADEAVAVAGSHGHRTPRRLGRRP